ncbi:MAG: leucine-rich repeat domain-containing protein [Clostridia bacterium]|nr:leucine-rich repeat domain-containing protein [Clostridia bacterium]
MKRNRFYILTIFVLLCFCAILLASCAASAPESKQQTAAGQTNETSTPAVVITASADDPSTTADDLTPPASETVPVTSETVTVTSETATPASETPTHLHVFSGDWIVIKDATCLEEGTRYNTCAECGQNVLEQIPAKGHTVVTEDAVEPTCTENGWTEGKYCTVCNAIFTERTEVPSLGHVYVDGVCARCGEYSGQNLAFSYDSSSESYTVDGIGSCAESNVMIPSTHNGKPVTSIGNGAFYDCRGLTSVTIPDSVTEIGERAFYGCTSMTSVTIPNSVTSIGWGAFYNCTGLTSVTIPDSVTSIGGYAFCNCTGLTSVTIPDSVSSIGENAFEGCTGLTCVTIPDSVSEIGNWAFNGCTGLTSVTIPDSVTSIGRSAFYGCTNLNYNTYNNAKYLGNSSNPYFALISASSSDITYVTIHTNTKSIAGGAFSGCTGLTSATIPDSVTSIGNGAFEDCTGLTSVTIPDSVTSIGGYAFYNCTGLTSVTIPDSVTSIGGYAFCNCTGLTRVTIPDGVTSIGELAFYNCTGLTSVTIGNGVTEIGRGAFWYCTKLTTVYYRGSSAQWSQISIGSNNDPLKNATKVYNYTGA